MKKSDALRRIHAASVAIESEKEEFSCLALKDPKGLYTDDPLCNLYAAAVWSESNSWLRDHFAVDVHAAYPNYEEAIPFRLMLLAFFYALVQDGSVSVRELP